jgi:hypothetical protein
MRRTTETLTALLLLCGSAACTHSLKVEPNAIAGHGVSRLRMKEGAIIYFDRAGACLVGDSLVGVTDDKEHPQRVSVAIKDVAEAESSELSTASSGAVMLSVLAVVITLGGIAAVVAIIGH